MFLLGSAMASEQEKSTASNPVIAAVNGRDISLNLFLRTLQDGVKKTFYHGKIPESEFIKFRHKTLTALIDEFLLSEHARKIGIKPDAEAINSTLQKYDNKYSKHPQWAANRERVLEQLQQDLERAVLAKEVERQVKGGIAANDADTEKYYRLHPEKFTTPQQYDVAVILLSVDPSSGSSGWEAGHKEAAEIYQQLSLSGEKFAELAKIHSSHTSSQQGGELGLIHAGTLSEEVDAALAKMKQGEISTPIRVLEGYAIVKLNQRVPAQLNGYDRVKERAGKLCTLEMRERGWADFVQGIKDKSDIYINMDEINKITIKN